MPISTNCQSLVAGFDKKIDEVTAVAKAPQVMMRTLNGMIKNSSAVNLSVASKAFDDLANGLGLTTISDDFSKLKTALESFASGTGACAKSIISNPLIQAAIGADLASMTGITDVTKITGKLKAYTIEQAKANAMAALEKGMSKMGLGGQLASVEMGYKKMLKSSGILDGIDLMNDIADCMDSACSGISGGYQLKVDAMLSNVHFDNGTATGLWSASAPASQTAISDNVKQGNAIATRISNWNGGAF
jgi:hypothetical protein